VGLEVIGVGGEDVRVVLVVKAGGGNRSRGKRVERALGYFGPHVREGEFFAMQLQHLLY
jgi:hypothetical protein